MQKKKYSFSTRIFLYIVPWTAVIIIGMSIFSAWYLFKTVKTERENSMEIIIKEKARDFETYFTEVKSTMAYIASLPEIEIAMTQYQYLKKDEKYQLNNKVSAYLNGQNIFKEYIEDIIVIGTNGYYKNAEAFSNIKYTEIPLEWESIREYKASENSRYDFISPYIADYYETSPHMVFSVVLPMYVQQEIIGYIQVNLSYEELLKRFQNEKGLEDAKIQVLDKEGKVVLSEQEDKIGGKAKAEYPINMDGNEGRFLYDNGKKEMVVYQKSDVTGWYFYGVIPYEVLMNSGYKAARVLIGGVLPVGIFTMCLIIIFLIGKIKKPLKKLVNRVESVNQENYEMAMIDYEVSEIQIVGDEFEKAMGRIHELIQNVYQAEIRKKNAEYETLRNQITPHFMYNSLQLIKAEAILSKNRDISRIVTALANLLRYSMNSSVEIVRAEEEINYIQDYLELYKRRYVDKFDYEFSVQADIMDRRVPKLILQPLVENSIRHGFASLRKGGMIRVSGRAEGDTCVFEIYDNGCGISGEQIGRIMGELKNNSRDVSGIGLNNVHQRILLQCGNGCGITEIDSCKNVYTRIMIRVSIS